MKLIKNESVISILQNTLNHVDPRLVDHGTRVAYLMFKVLMKQNKYDRKQLHDICILAMLHDIGAYKTEEIDKLTVFETSKIWEHSIYGFLFLKYFSPLKDYAEAILFHHANCNEIMSLRPSLQELAQIISLCDRVDIFLLSSNNIDGLYQLIEKGRDTKYRSNIIDLFMSANIDLHKINERIHSDNDFISTFYDTPITSEEADEYLKMIIFSIDFRSSQTVIHTVGTVCASRMLAELSGFNKDDIEKITTGAMLHDIGKTGIPVFILESPNRLTKEEMEIMKTHVDMTDKIISGNVDGDIKQIAVQHHEKLNGSGYPKRLDAQDIILSGRIVSIADIFSALCCARSYKGVYSKERTVTIFNDMSAEGLIDAEIVSLLISNYDRILEEMDAVSQPVIDAYNKLNAEYSRILENVKNSNFEGIVI
jgi:HD-GYP domain-containing protein (c-di-GMP phosphodiesterase class II)